MTHKITVREVRRPEPDLDHLVRALLLLIQARAGQTRPAGPAAEKPQQDQHRG